MCHELSDFAGCDKVVATPVARVFTTYTTHSVCCMAWLRWGSRMVAPCERRCCAAPFHMYSMIATWSHAYSVREEKVSWCDMCCASHILSIVVVPCPPPLASHELRRDVSFQISGVAASDCDRLSRSTLLSSNSCTQRVLVKWEGIVRIHVQRNLVA